MAQPRAATSRTRRSSAETNGTAGTDAAASPEETVAMNKWILSAWVLVLAATPVAAADVRLDNYRNPKNENFRIFNHMYLDGVKGGLMASNAWIRSRGGEMAFCMPPDLALSTEQAEEIMLKSADKRAAKGDWLVASLLLWGLRDTFPCDNTGSR
jgi:hypothetical protein